MRYNVRLCILALALPLLGQACTREAEEAAMTGQPGIEARMQKYALTPMQMDLRDYSDRDKALIGELLKAAELADEIFWRQTSHVAQPMREQLEASDPEDDPLRRFFMMQAGPYDRLDHDARFLEDVPPKSAGAAFYPDDFTAEEFGAWIDGHPEDREAFLSPYTVIRRDGERLARASPATWASKLTRCSAIGTSMPIRRGSSSRARSSTSRSARSRSMKTR
jgi:hypothetical protein